MVFRSLNVTSWVTNLRFAAITSVRLAQLHRSTLSLLLVKTANSLAFVDGVPSCEPYFLGDEFTIRGYNVRSISPIAPLDTFITSQNVVFATNDIGTPVVVSGLPPGAAQIGVFTGSSGGNVVQLPRTFTSIGGDSQLLGNFEYRIPIVSDFVSLAAFADIGSAFNIRSKGDQQFSS